MGRIVRAFTVRVGDSCFSTLRAEMDASLLSFGAGHYLIFFTLSASIESRDFKPPFCLQFLLSQCIPRDSTSGMRWNKWLQRLLTWCTQSALSYGPNASGCNNRYWGKNRYCPVHLVFRIRLNDFIFSQVKKLPSEFEAEGQYGVGSLSSETPQSHGALSFDCVGNVTMVALPSRLSITLLNLPEPVSLHTFAMEKTLVHCSGQKSKLIWHCRGMTLLFFCSGNVSKFVPNAQFCDCNH